MPQPLLLLDLDPVKYATAFSIEKRDKESDILYCEPIKHAFYNVNSMVRKMLKRCESDNYQAFLTKLGDKTNFRFQFFDDYKANRIGIRKPVYLKEVHDFILKRWNAIEAVGEEADDLCSIWQYKYNPFGFDEKVVNSVICTIDKDLNNVPGWHYNYRSDEFYFVTELQALQNFYLQILAGDVSDNVPRIKKGWRQRTAEDRIKKAANEEEMIGIVTEEVRNVLEKNSTEENSNDEIVKNFIDRNGKLVWLRREEGEIWALPKYKEAI